MKHRRKDGDPISGIRRGAVRTALGIHHEQMRLTKLLKLLLFTLACFSIPKLISAQTTTTLFFDDFSGPRLNQIYRPVLPNASWRFGSPDAIYIGASAYKFQNLGSASVIRLHNVLDNAQRKGWSTSAQFPSSGSICLEARLNTLVQSPKKGIDELFELWILDPANLSRYDKVALSAPDYGQERIFSAGSSITDVGLDTPFAFSDNTWYRMVITGSQTREVRLSIYDDTGATELIGVSVGHTLDAYNDGFEIGLSQSMGEPGAPYPTDVAVDWIKLTVAATTTSTLADISSALALGRIDNQGIANALSSKINAASSAAAGGDNKTASNILNVFINEVNAQAGKHLFGITPQVLLADANSLLDQLQ